MKATSYLRKHLQPKAICPLGVPGKESDRTVWSHCTRQRSRLLSGEMKHPSEMTGGLWVTRHWCPLADKVWLCLVAFQRHMSSGVFQSELQAWRRITTMLKMAYKYYT